MTNGMHFVRIDLKLNSDSWKHIGPIAESTGEMLSSVRIVAVPVRKARG